MTTLSFNEIEDKESERRGQEPEEEEAESFNVEPRPLLRVYVKQC
jgi:hypothetical protein